MKQQILFILLAITAGALLPFQAGLNVQLGKAVHQPVFAAFASFLVGSAGLFIYLLIIKFDFSATARLRHVSPWVWTAGLLGAFYVCSVIVAAPRLGTALTFSLVVAGQMAVALALDQFGAFGLPIKQINWPRMLGVVLLLSGVLLIRKF